MVSSAMIRRVTVEDFPWCHAICNRAYPGEWDAVDGELWFHDLMRREDRYLARGKHCLLMGGVGKQPYNLKKIAASMEMLASDGKAGFEVVTIVRSFMDWGKRKGAVRFVFNSKANVDFGSVADRVGARMHYGPTYVVEL